MNIPHSIFCPFKPKTKDLVCYILPKNETLFSYRFKLRPQHNIGGGTHFSGWTNPDSGGTFKLLKYHNMPWLAELGHSLLSDIQECKSRVRVSTEETSAS